MQKVVVRPLYRIKAGMWLTFHRDDIIHCNIQGKQLVQPEHQVEIPCLLQIHMEEELAGVYLGIRPSAAVNGYLSLKDLAQGFLYHPLHVHHCRLALPSIILQAVVAYMYKVSQGLIFFLLFCSAHLPGW